MTDTKLRAYDLISGQTARNYRKKLAGFAEGKKTSFLATKFQLDVSSKSVPLFANCRKAYDTVEGVGEGSLAYLLFSVILSGFRIFPSEAEAIGFAQRAAYDNDGFEKAVREVFGGDIPDFRPASILKRLATGVRSTGGKDNSYTESVIYTEYQKSLAKKKEKTVDQAKVDAVFKAIASALMPFESWKSLQKSILPACEAIDKVLSSYASFPSLAAMFQNGNVEHPQKSTLAFDNDAAILNPDAGCVPYAVVASILMHYSDTEGAADKYVQKHLTTNTHSGLSWLFGKGLEYLRSTSVEKIAKAYGVPHDKLNSVERIKAAAEAIDNQDFLWKGKKALSYAGYRSSIGGRLDSWVANYVKRLMELDKLLEKMPDTLSIPQAFEVNGDDFLDTTDCKRPELEFLCQTVNTSRAHTKSCLNKLLGAARTDEDIVQSVKGVLECSDVLNRLHAVSNQLSNAMEQAGKDENSAWRTIAHDAKAEFAQWNTLKKLPKLNGMKGGVPLVEEELKAALIGYHEVIKARSLYLQRLNAWMEQEGNKPQVVLAQEKVELRHLTSRNANRSVSASELGIRFLLDRVGKLVRERKDQCAKDIIDWFAVNRIFKNQKDHNTYFCNCLGSLYISPFANNRHHGYVLSETVVPNRELLWNSLVQFVEGLSYAPFTEEAETLLRLSLWVQGRVISAIDRPIPMSVVEMMLPECYRDAVPESLRLEMKQQEVYSSTVAKALNIFTSLLSGFAIVLRRNKFYLRTKFTWIENNALLYVPKDGEWAIPERYWENPYWANMLDKAVLVRADNGKVDVQKTFSNVLKQIKAGEKGLGMLLRQLPHDWYYSLPFKSCNDNDGINVLKVAKAGSLGTEIFVRQEQRCNLARLIGPSSLKSRLDSLLIDKESVVGDMTLLVDQPVRQEIVNGEIKLVYDKPIMTLAVPLEQNVKVASEGELLPFTRIVAIDQGENGLAYAVFNLSDYGKSDARPITVGTIAIRSIRRLIRGVKKYRKGGQATQKFNQRFDSSMFTMRENVAGDVCGVIEGLMSRFRAFPILENEVKNLASGSKQLALVYKMVNARFLYSDVDMQNNERKSWWYGAERWLPSGFWRAVPESVEDKKNLLMIDGIKYKQLNIFPGAGVTAAMTSRICSHCGRNVFDLLKEAKVAGVKKVHIGQDGEVDLGGETLKLYHRPDKDAAKAAARRNERAEWTQPLKEGEMKLDDLAKHVRANLRRPPKSLQSKDTTQSRYFCVFKSCDWNRIGYHADMNAAINIGRRFLASIRYVDPLKVEIC